MSAFTARPVARRPFAKKGLSGVLALIVAAIAALSSYFVPTRNVPEAEGLSVESWNMEWFPSGYVEPQAPSVEARRIETAARAIRRSGVPDVLLVQEIRDRATCDALAREIGAPGFRPVVCSEFWHSPTNVSLQQLAIFSKLPCVTNGWEAWQARDFVYPPRGYAWAVLETKTGPVAFFDVHLKSNYVPEDQDEKRQAVLNRLKRQLSAEQILAHIARIREEGVCGRPLAGVVLAGDFNTAAEDPRFEKESTLRKVRQAGLRHAFEGIPEAERPTLPANDWYPAATFDHLFYDGPGLGRPLSRRVLPRSPVSDHCPIRAVFPAE